MQSQFARHTGPGAGVVKYDILTALSVMALRQSPTVQTTILRLIALVTARYNWKLDQFSVPQGDMARMWNVSDRTVKREVKRMVQTDLIQCIRPGVRGRVGAYRLNRAHLSNVSRDSWADVGPDFEDRMQQFAGGEAKVLKVDFINRHLPEPDLPSPGDDLWGDVLRDLSTTDPANLRNWYMKLTLDSVVGHRVRLTAPTAFVAQFVQTHLSRALIPALSRQIGQEAVVEIQVQNP